MLQELDRVVLTRGLQELGLEAGDIGIVVLVDEGGPGFEAELVKLNGETCAVTTVMADDVWPIERNEIAHARALVA